jgi:soluble lytic murein transglycosylase
VLRWIGIVVVVQWLSVERRALAETKFGPATVVNPAFPVPSQADAEVALVEQRPPAEPVLMTRASLSPYFEKGTLRDARALFARGAYAEARRRLEAESQTPPVRFLKALAAFRMQLFAAAGPEFESLAAEYPNLADRCWVHAGWAFERLGEFERAERAFEGVQHRSRVWPDALLGRARVVKQLRGAKKALEVLRPLSEVPAPPWGRDVGAEALFLVAGIHQALGNVDEEQAALGSLWARHPLASQTLRTEHRLGAAVRRSVELKVQRAENLIDVHRNAQGLQLVEPVLSVVSMPDALACRAAFAAGKAYRKLRAHVRAIPLLASVVRQCSDPELRAKALYTLGTSQSAIAPEAAVETYEALVREYPEHSLADDALFFAADARLRAGDADGALARWAELVERFPLSEMAADGLFKLFWAERARGEEEAALGILSEIEARFAQAEDSHDVERARYWRAQLLEQHGDREAALQIFQENAQNYAPTFYGLLSRERAEALAPDALRSIRASTAAASSAADVFPIDVGAVGDDPQFRSAVELLRLGFGELVPMEILGVDRTLASQSVHRLLVVMLSMAGEDRAAHGMARLWLRRDLSRSVTHETRLLWEIAYPKPFRALVETHAAAADGLDPDLLQAVMREESALDPKAMSWAGALGLCQLMPATAAETARRLGLSPPSVEALLEPDLNVRLGARYLADLIARFDGVGPYVIASYNAGPSAVSRWRKDHSTDDLATWVEEIPLQETRQYVKRVLRSYSAYKLLYSPGAVPRTILSRSKKGSKQEPK